MEQAHTLEEFVRDPIGRYFADESWFCFYPTPELSGFVVWGRLTETEMRKTAVITPEIHRGAGRHVGLIDARRVEQVDMAAFVAIAEYARRYRKMIDAAIQRAALVYGPGITRAVASGFFQILQPVYGIEVFGDLTSALDWLQVDDAKEIAIELDTLQAEVAGTTPLIRDLRAYLHKSIHASSVAGAAKTLHLSERSLQRRLREHGTSFKSEVALARTRMAEGLLADPNATLTEIAFAVGCASLHHFTSMFRKVTTLSPAEWRQRHLRSLHSGAGDGDSGIGLRHRDFDRRVQRPGLPAQADVRSPKRQP